MRAAGARAGGCARCGHGATSNGPVIEKPGIGATGEHTCRKAGTNTVTVRDDDGGSDTQTSRVTLR